MSSILTHYLLWFAALANESRFHREEKHHGIERTATPILRDEPVGLFRPEGIISQLHAKTVAGAVPHPRTHRYRKDNHGEKRRRRRRDPSGGL